MRKNIRLQLAYVLAAIGGGLLIYGFLQWRALPVYSEKDVQLSTELNLSLDLARMPPDRQPPTNTVNEIRESIRAEVLADIARERANALAWLQGGAVFLVMAVVQLLVQRWLARGPSGSP